MKIMFVCLGNICRSAIAEFMMKDALKKRGISEKYVIDSAATCGLEAGNPVYPDALKKLIDSGEQYDEVIALFETGQKNRLRQIRFVHWNGR